MCKSDFVKTLMKDFYFKPKEIYLVIIELNIFTIYKEVRTKEFECSITCIWTSDLASVDSLYVMTK